VTDHAPCTIRRAKRDDLRTITAIYRHHVLHGFASFEEKPPSLDEMTRRHDEILRRRLPYLAAVAGERIVGYAYAAPYRTRSAYRYTLEDSVYVAPSAARRGIGRALLTRLIADCEESGFRQLVAVIGDSAHLPSIRLHEALGFRRAGMLQSVGFKLGRWVDSVLMQRPLGTGDADLPSPRGTAP
jgi:L-amino acid N-acyltransferase YncA